MQVDLNCDFGEGFGSYEKDCDDKILDFVSSVNIACGFHAGDPVIMERKVKLALSKGVSIGAHPGYPDLLGFGRRTMNISLEEARAYIIYQVGALNAFVQANGGTLKHVKPHGALYNAAAKDYTLARAIAEAVYDVDCELTLVGLANSMLIKAAADVGLKAAHEVFADRAYNSDGSLVSRNADNAVIKDERICVERVVRMVREGKVTSVDGNDVPIKPDTICIHGDNPMAPKFAEMLRKNLMDMGIKIAPFNCS